MKLLETKHLIAEFEHHLSTSKGVDVAVAWAKSGRAIDLIKEVGGTGAKIRIIVGLDMNGTHPIALETLQEIGEIRIGSSANGGVFHPKFFLFRKESGNIVWFGSANLTAAAFATNTELVVELEDSGDAARWFEDMWEALPENCTRVVEEYISRWRPSFHGGLHNKTETQPVDASIGRHPIKLIDGNSIKSWEDYLTSVRTIDEYWKAQPSAFSLLDESWSYVETIATGHDIVENRDWVDLTELETTILLGLNEDTGAWALLGGMRGAAKAVSVFRNDARVRREIRRWLEPVLKTSDTDVFVQVANTFVSQVTSLERFGPAIATRLIALARPDRGVSVNDGSRRGLAHLAGLPTSTSALGNHRNYASLLRWVYAQPWYQSPEPTDGFERLVWSMRAALIDSFVYQYEA